MGGVENIEASVTHESRFWSFIKFLKFVIWTSFSLLLLSRGFFLYTKRTRQARAVTIYGLAIVLSLSLIMSISQMLYFANYCFSDDYDCDTHFLIPKYWRGAAIVPALSIGFLFLYFFTEGHRSKAEVTLYCYFLALSMSEILEEFAKVTNIDEINFTDDQKIFPLAAFTLLAYIRLVNFVKSAKLVEDDICAYDALWQMVPKEFLFKSNEGAAVKLGDIENGADSRYER